MCLYSFYRSNHTKYHHQQRVMRSDYYTVTVVDPCITNDLDLPVAERAFLIWSRRNPISSRGDAMGGGGEGECVRIGTTLTAMKQSDFVQ